MISLLVALLPVVWTIDDQSWSKEVAVLHGNVSVVRYQARIVRNFLFVKATHEDGWHTYAMDNEMRAAAALQGKMSLGIEQGTDIIVDTGLELDHAWLQTKPKDLSKPELRWFTYGFDQTAVFACRVKAVTADQVMLRIRGQACSGETCCKVDVQLNLQAVNHPSDDQQPSPAKLLERLVAVRTQNDLATAPEPNPSVAPQSESPE